MLTKYAVLLRSLFIIVFLVLAWSGFFSISYQTKAYSASCAPPVIDYGKVSSTVNIPATGNYRVWSRIKAVDSAHNTYLLKIDASCYNIGGNISIPNGEWKWIDYQDGVLSNKVQLTNLSAGVHSIEVIGNTNGVELDRIIFTQDFDCLANAVSSDKGDACANPVVVLMPGDTNNSGTVNIIDLLVVINHWGLTGQSRANGDLTGDGNVTILDLLQVLNNWTG